MQQGCCLLTEEVVEGRSHSVTVEAGGVLLCGKVILVKREMYRFIVLFVAD